MEWARLLAQVIIALGILNVWIVRFSKPTGWRGGRARNMREEFAIYGLPYWFMLLIGLLKLTLAALLVIGIWFPELTRPAAWGMAVLMAGAVLMHFKVGDPVKKALPALTMLALSLFVAISA